MNELAISADSQIHTTVMVPIRTSENASFWRIPNSTELVPVAILALEVLLGLLCNFVAAWIYLGQSGLLKNAGNKFTISLIVDDLILSGIATPLVLLVELVEPETSPLLMNYLCICTRCALLFSAISSALGNTLLALDRVDITLRPSRRFFRQKRPARAVAFVWLLSGLGFIFPLVSTWASHSFEVTQQHNHTIILKNHEWIHLTTSSVQANKVVLNKINYDAYCVTTCSISYCELTEIETIIRHSFQLAVFAIAVVVIFVSYFQILKSIHQRNVRHAKKSIHPARTPLSPTKKTQLGLQQIFCCVESHERDVLLAMNTQTNQNSRQDSENKVSNAPLPRMSSPSMKSSQNVHLNKKSQVPSDKCTKQDQNCKDEAESGVNKQAENNSSGLLVVAQSDNKKGTTARTDFVSVALSVKAIMTMKKMVREKKKRKAKKIRHLKLMTVLITLTFVICWTPFNIFPLIKLFTNRAPSISSICEVQFCFNKTNFPVFDIGQKLYTRNKQDSIWNALFLWTLVLVSASSVANPFLYSFSREKIRQDFKKLFCTCRQTRNTIVRERKKKDSTSHLRPKPTIQTTVWSFEYEKNNCKNLENEDIMKPLVNKTQHHEHTSADNSNKNGVSSASTMDAKHRLLPDTASQHTNRANDESTVETSCTSAATN